MKARAALHCAMSFPAVPAMRLLISILLLSFCITVQAAAPATGEDQLRRLVGTYNGKVFNGDDLDDVVTTFKIDEIGRLTGEYTVDEETGVYSGTLSDVIFDDDHSVSMEWTDKFGEGFAEMQFSDDFRSFTGNWTDKDGSRPLPWNGKRQ